MSLQGISLGLAAHGGVSQMDALAYAEVVRKIRDNFDATYVQTGVLWVRLLSDSINRRVSDFMNLVCRARIRGRFRAISSKQHQAPQIDPRPLVLQMNFLYRLESITYIQEAKWWLEMHPFFPGWACSTQAIPFWTVHSISATKAIRRYNSAVAAQLD